VGVDGFIRLGLGHVTHSSSGSLLDEGQDARAQQRCIGSAVRSGPLLRRRVKTPGQMVPGETVKVLGQTPALRVFDVGQDAGQLADRHDGVRGAVVLAERTFLLGVVVESLEALPAVVEQGAVFESLAGDECDIRPHDGDVGVAGPDVAPLDGTGGVQDRLSHLLLQRSGQTVHVVDRHLEQLRAAEVGPVPVGRRHLIERFFEKPRPDSVGAAAGVLVLKIDHAVENLLGPLQTVGVVRIEQGHRVDQRIAGAVDRAGFERRVVARRRERPRQHPRGPVVALILRRQGLEKALAARRRREEIGAKARSQVRCHDQSDPPNLSAYHAGASFCRIRVIGHGPMIRRFVIPIQPLSCWRQSVADLFCIGSARIMARRNERMNPAALREM